MGKTVWAKWRNKLRKRALPFAARARMGCGSHVTAADLAFKGNTVNGKAYTAGEVRISNIPFVLIKIPSNRYISYSWSVWNRSKEYVIANHLIVRANAEEGTSVNNYGRLTVDSLLLGGHSIKGFAEFRIGSGFIFTSKNGTMVSPFAQLSFGAPKAMTHQSMHNGDITINASKTYSVDELNMLCSRAIKEKYPLGSGVKWYNATLQTTGLDTILGNLTINAGTLEQAGNRGKQTALSLNVTGDVFFGKESSWILAPTGKSALLTGNRANTLTVKDGSQLFIVPAKPGTYWLTSHFASVDNDGGKAWVGDNLLSSPMYAVTGSWVGNICYKLEVALKNIDQETA